MSCWFSFVLARHTLLQERYSLMVSRWLSYRDNPRTNRLPRSRVEPRKETSRATAEKKLMYIPAAFAETDLTKLHDFIEQHSFGLLVSQVDGVPSATHLPFLLERTTGR